MNSSAESAELEAADVKCGKLVAAAIGVSGDEPSAPVCGYQAGFWTPAVLYRSTPYLVMDAIRRSGSDGIGRVECAKYAGVPANKTGFRRNGFENIFGAIVKHHPDKVGAFQKQHGRQRYWRYYWKTEKTAVQGIFDEFEEMTGRKIDMGSSVKFPDHKLQPLRMSDVTVSRLVTILKILRERKYIIQRYILQRLLVENEKKRGTTYAIDRKSLRKLMTVLERWQLLSVYQTTICETGVEKKLEIIFDAAVADDADVLAAAIDEARAEFFKAPERFQKVGTAPPQPRLLQHSVDTDDDGAGTAEAPGGALAVAAIQYDIEKIAIDEARAEFFKAPERFQKVGTAPPPPRLTQHSVDTDDDGAGTAEVASTVAAIQYDIEKIDIPAAGLSVNDRLSSFGRVKVKREVQPSDDAVQSQGADADEGASHELCPAPPNDTPTTSSTGNEGQRVFDAAAAAFYGYQGRMYRASLLHQLLFYMLYGYEGDGPRMYDKYSPGVRIGAEFRSDCDNGHPPHVYLDVDDWRRFLPPLPTYTG